MLLFYQKIRLVTYIASIYLTLLSQEGTIKMYIVKYNHVEFLYWKIIMNLSITVRKCLLIFVGVGFSISTFASCEVRVSSFVNVKNGSSSIVGFDDLSHSMKTWTIPTNALISNSVTFPFYGKHLDCSTPSYKKQPLFVFSLTPFCNKSINSLLLSELKDGEYYSQKCSDNLSIDALKTNDDSVFRISIVPTGFHALVINNLIPNRSESQNIAFKTTNMDVPKIVEIGASPVIFKNGFHYFHNDGIQQLLYNVDKSEKPSLDFFVFDKNSKTKIGTCNFLIDQRKSVIKCQTIANSNNYKIVVQYDTVYLIDLENNY